MSLTSRTNFLLVQVGIKKSDYTETRSSSNLKKKKQITAIAINEGNNVCKNAQMLDKFSYSMSCGIYLNYFPTFKLFWLSLCRHQEVEPAMV